MDFFDFFSTVDLHVQSDSRASSCFHGCCVTRPVVQGMIFIAGARRSSDSESASDSHDPCRPSNESPIHDLSGAGHAVDRRHAPLWTVQVDGNPPHHLRRDKEVTPVISASRLVSHRPELCLVNALPFFPCNPALFWPIPKRNRRGNHHE